VEVTKADNLDAALKEAKNRRVPIVIALGIPDSEIGQDVKALTGKDGKIVFFSIMKEDADALACRRHYDLEDTCAVLTDEFGNLLKPGLKDSEAIADACYEVDDLLADRYQAWTKAIQKGEALLGAGKFPEAALVLKDFAFASGTDLAEQGKRLFNRVSEAASKEYEALTASTKGRKAEKIVGGEREKLLADLDAFMKRWPKTPAAFSAASFAHDLAAAREMSSPDVER